ncbi:non-ribosomal peptide synthetase [Simkania negevensis]|uniref:non-ribosomal peptide synthetase n=1 Tax=Simkania negevensis TaxID=83561 RepID=UPI0013053CA9|nr:non-ribosomal peptide synthetase [Simkania negevensis]
MNKNLVDLVFFVDEQEDSHTVHIAAARKVFQLATVESMIGHFCTLLESALDHPHRELNVLEYLAEDELRLLNYEFAEGVEENYPDNIICFFEKQVSLSPDEIAIYFQDEALTYAELNNKINQMAHYLKNLGISHGSVVAVSCHHDPDVIVTIFAIIRLGATYLPLDPSYPDTRLNMMIQDAKPEILVTRSSVAEKFSGFSNPIVNLDTDMEKVAKSSSSSVSEQGLAENPVYIIYTSGSTGKPKGIMISYESLPHLCLERKRYYPNKTIAMLTGSISFDVSILTIFHSLMTGGTLCIPDQSERVDGEALIKHMAKFRVNFFMCVPSFYAMMLEKEVPFPKSLEIMSLVGEVIPNSLPPLHAQFAPHVKLFNEYGPCEIALGSNLAQIYDPLTEKISPIHVGKPLPNTEVYVLDANLQLVPIGMRGEICLGGKGLAMGYLNRNNLTAEKFVKVALPGKALTRLYRTGDYGRWLPDGNLEFLGRMDYQVKIRGHRVELGEVEAVLCQHKEIDEAVVKVQKMKDHQDCLVAYFTTIGRKILSVGELRKFLDLLLPKFAVPSHFMQLEYFPRTHNRKIDRKALPIFPVAEVADDKNISHKGVKQTLLEIWKKALNLYNIGPDDNFFDVGGNSLLLANIQTAVKEVLKVNVPIIEYFRYSTINSFAKYLESLKSQDLRKARSS